MTNKAQAFTALNTFADSRTALIQGMQAAGYKTLETCKPVVIEWACAKTGAEYRETKAGKVVLVTDHAKYESAKSVVRDVMLMLQGTTRHATRESARKENDPITALAAKLAKLSAADQRKVLKLAGL